MRKLHSFLLVSFAILSFALSPSKARASHAAGGEIIYEWISDSTYRFFFKFYRDCTGIEEPPTVGLCITNSCTTGSDQKTMEKWTGPLPGGITNGDPVSAGCSQYKTRCELASSSIPGYREWWYQYLWTSPGKCNNYNFSVAINARNSNNNITTGPLGSFSLYVETTFE